MGALNRRVALLSLILLPGVLLLGCPGEIPQGTGTTETGDSTDGYVILGTSTDNFDYAAAKSLAEDALAANPDLGCMVGLFAYNPPYILEALKGADRVGKVQLVGFDEADETLQAIIDGQCHGTVVQNPYMYGYESVRILAGLARGDESVLPEGGFLDIPAKKITHDNVEEFWTELNQRVEEGKNASPASISEDAPTVAYVTNGIASFWVIAEAGARKAARDFGVNLEVRMPPKGIADQKRMVEELLTLDVDGIAISPIDPENQTDLLNQAAEQTHLITQDSDAPKSKRLCYVGMSNYDAGRMCGQLVKEAMPEGGSVMIFVGRIEQDNAKLRRQGVIDEVMDRSYDPTRFDPPGKVIRSSDAGS